MHQHVFSTLGDAVCAGNASNSRELPGPLPQNRPTEPLEPETKAPAGERTNAFIQPRNSRNRQDSIQPLPKAPPPIPEWQPLTRMQELAIEKGFADRNTLPQYDLVDEGMAISAGHYNEYETHNLRAGQEILVHVTNWVFPFTTPVQVSAGPSFQEAQTQILQVPPGTDQIFRFKNKYDLNRYFRIGSDVDAYSLEFHIYSRGTYAKSE